MRLATILRLGIKDLRGLLRDPVLICLIVFSVAIAILAASHPVSHILNPGPVRNVPVAVVDGDGSQLSRRLADIFQPPYFATPALVTPDQMEVRMNGGAGGLGLDIPPHFQNEIVAGKSPVLLLHADGTRMDIAVQATGHIRSMIAREIAGFTAEKADGAAPEVHLALRHRFGVLPDRAWFAAMTAVINNLALLSLILAGAGLLRERERGMLDYLPARPPEILLARLWSTGLVVLLAAGLSLAVLARPLPTDRLLLLLAGSGLHFLAAAGIGLSVATLAGSMQRFGLLVALVLVPLQLMSGSVTPRDSMPDALQTIMLAAPDTHFILLAEAILIRGADISTAWPQLLWLAGIASASFGYALVGFRRSDG